MFKISDAERKELISEVNARIGDAWINDCINHPNYAKENYTKARIRILHAGDRLRIALEAKTMKEFAQKDALWTLK